MIEISNIIADFIFLILTMIVIIPIMYSISLAQLLAAQINTKSTAASSFVFKVSINRIAWICLCAYQQTLQLFLVHWLICNNLMLLLSVFFVVSGLLSLQAALSTTLLLTCFSCPVLLIDRWQFNDIAIQVVFFFLLCKTVVLIFLQR